MHKTEVCPSTSSGVSFLRHPPRTMHRKHSIQQASSFFIWRSFGRQACVPNINRVLTLALSIFLRVRMLTLVSVRTCLSSLNFYVALEMRCSVKHPASSVVIEWPKYTNSRTFSITLFPIQNRDFSVARLLSLNTCVLVFLNDIVRPNRKQVSLMIVSNCLASNGVLQNNTRSSAYNIHCIISVPDILPSARCARFVHVCGIAYSILIPQPLGNALSIASAATLRT